MTTENDPPETGQNPQEPLQSNRFAVCTWFVPLEDRLSIADGHIIKIPKARGPFDPGWTVHTDQFLRSTESITSLKVWHLPSQLAGLHERTALAFEASQRAFPMYFDDPSRFSLDDWPISLETSVVEVAITIYAAEFDRARFAKLFEESIFHIQRLQRANAYVTGRPVRSVSFASLPPHLPMTTSTLEETGLKEDGGVHVYNLEDNVWQYPAQNDFNDQELERFHSYLNRDTGAFSGFLASSHDARAALLHRGDARGSILASATACEILLDDFFKHLLWEAARKPEDCVDMFVSRRGTSTILSRVQTLFDQVIDGQWNVASGGAVAKWQQRVAHVRNRSVHTGYVPTIAEASAAIEATDDLHQYVMDRLFVNASAFPRTALVAIGIPRLQTLGFNLIDVEEMLTAERPDDWDDRFQRWRVCLNRQIDSRLGRLDFDPADAVLVAVIDGRERVRWVRHHRSAGLAANVGVTDLPQAVADSISDMASALPDDQAPISVGFNSSAKTSMLEDWTAEHRRIPMCGVMVDGCDFY